MRKAVFGKVAAAMVLGLAVTACGNSAKWKDGTFTGAAEGMHGDVEMSVTISKGKITKIDVVSQSETKGVSDAAFEQVPGKIIEKQGIEVDTVAGATISSKAIIGAVEEALGKAK